MRVRIVPRPATATNAPEVIRPSATIAVASRPMRVLDFDVEARPLHWISGDYVSKEITAMAWAWTDKPEAVTCYVLGEVNTPTMLKAFVAAYNDADMVTGHFIIGYDLLMVCGALTEYQMPMLSKKLVSDTKLHLVKRAGLSGSQENIGAMLGLAHEKVKMDQTKWRDANRLTPEGREEVKKRVIGDVLQHIEMRQRLLELGYLGPARVWESNGTQPLASYTP